MKNNKDIIIIPNDTRYWLMRANSGEFYADFKINNFIAIEGNKVDLDSLTTIESKFRANSKILKSHYKTIFKKAYEENLLSEVMSQHAVSLRSNQTFMFIEEMKIGDIVLVPSQSSTHLLIGIIVGDANENEINRSALFDENEFNQCEYNKKRSVLWLKEIQREELPNNMLGIINTHQGLLNLDHFAEQINSVISLLNYYKGVIYFTIRVETLNPIDSVTWLNFQQLIVDSADDKANKIYQKKSVESPGEIILETIADNWEAIFVIFAILFGEVNYKGFKLRGLISRFFPRNIKIDELEIQQKEAEINLKTAETEKIQAETAQIRKNVDLMMEQENQVVNQLEKENHLRELDSSKMIYNKKSIETESERTSSIEKMELSNNEFGNEIPKRNQMDNLNL